MNYLFVCGGSAGHINPALAIAEQMRRKSPDADILFIGADKILEKRLIPEAGFRLQNIKMSGLRRGFSPSDIIHNVKTARNLISANFKSKKMLNRFKPDAVIGTGGYICYPVLKSAARSGIPTYVLEPNAYPGLAVRMLSSIVDKIFVTYNGLESRYKKPDRVVYTGTPLRSKFTSTDVDVTEKEKSDKPLVVSYWGSIGSTGMNIKITDFIERNIKEEKFNHIHATGVGGSVDIIKERLMKKGISEIKAPIADIREYISNMPTVMGSADIVITRAGASTIAELTAMGKPAILIPSPNVTENHQEENARQLEKAGGVEMILENECTGESLFDKVVSILEDKNKLKKMAEAQKSLSVQDAATKIVDIVLGCNSDNVEDGV